VNEAAFYILDGEGYEIHDGVRYDWKAGDVAIVHNNCVHQHFNADPAKPARALVMKPKPMILFMNMLFQQLVIPPGSCSGRHRHLAEECLYVLEGRGYDQHQDCDVEITDTYHWTPQAEVKRYEWEAGDVIYIPPNTIHQHFNASPDKPVRLISVINRIFKACGLNDLEQLEDAPEYDPAVVLNADVVNAYLRDRVAAAR